MPVSRLEAPNPLEGKGTGRREGPQANFPPDPRVPFVGRSGEQPRPGPNTGPPDPPGFFIEAGRSDPYSPVIGSLTRVEPPGPGRRLCWD